MPAEALSPYAPKEAPPPPLKATGRRAVPPPIGATPRTSTDLPLEQHAPIDRTDRAGQRHRDGRGRVTFRARRGRDGHGARGDGRERRGDRGGGQQRERSGEQQGTSHRAWISGQGSLGESVRIAARSSAGPGPSSSPRVVPPSRLGWYFGRLLGAGQHRFMRGRTTTPARDGRSGTAAWGEGGGVRARRGDTGSDRCGQRPARTTPAKVTRPRASSVPMPSGPSGLEYR